ncbi:MAG: CoA ester lyase, partial [Sphingomonadales bacterium]|nr:CoA ester lyase [Sphingomonadales bacterium]
MTQRLRRSVLYMPASNARAVTKARALPCDAVILDLEDGVSADKKTEARQQMADEVAKGGFGARELIVRVNAIDSAWVANDLAALA